MSAGTASRKRTCTPKCTARGLVDASRQYPSHVDSPGDEGQPGEQGEEHGPADDTEAAHRDEPDLPLQPKRHIVDEGRGE
jgi:hypothetical protein